MIGTGVLVLNAVLFIVVYVTWRFPFDWPRNWLALVSVIGVSLVLAQLRHSMFSS